jgi:quinol monooxygenase YgiN
MCDYPTFMERLSKLYTLPRVAASTIDRALCVAPIAVLLGTLALLVSYPRPAQASEDRGTLYVISHVDIAPKQIPGLSSRDFEKTMAAATAEAGGLLKQLAATCRKDLGCLSFEVLQQVGGPNHFTLVEAWTDSAAFEAHESEKETREIRAKLLPILGSPFDERLNRRLP